MRSIQAGFLLVLSLLVGVAGAKTGPGVRLLIISNPVPEAGDHFGTSVAPLGGNILVGAPGDSPGGVLGAGSVYLFDGSTGALLLTIPNPVPAPFDSFGSSVAAVGGTILIGAVADDPGGVTNAGSVYLFDGTTGALLLTIPNPTPAPYEYFGFSVAAAGRNILVGAPWDSPGGVFGAGSVYLFDGSTGALLLTIPNPAPGSDHVFGVSVAALGENILVGAPWASPGGVFGAGSVYLFDGSTGAFLLTIPNPAPAAGDQFGAAIGVLGGNILVGAPGDSPGGVTEAGSVYLFDGATGALLLTIPNPAPAPYDSFGSSVAAVGGNILVGAPSDRPGGVLGAGSVYLFEGTTGALLLAIPDPVPRSVNDYFGSSVAAVGGNILVGAPADNRDRVRDVGSVYLFAGTVDLRGSVAVGGAPVVATKVVLKNKDTGDWVKDTTDDAGAYQFGPVAAGTYQITVKPLIVASATTVSGSLRVKGVPSAGTPVRLRNVATGVVSKTTTDANGHFSFAVAVPGSYKLMVSTVTVP